MAVESRRGCGYRKVGGLYLVCDGAGRPCCKMPILLHVCPTCNQGIKQSRGWQWIDPRPWIASNEPLACPPTANACPLNDPAQLGEKVGLIWIGERFYATPEAFTQEADRMGISRRIKAVPRGFKVGEHWVFFAHPRVQRVFSEDGEGWIGGVFRIAKPTRIEKIVTDLEARDEEAMEKLREKGITPFIVPHDDRDHQGSPYDKDESDENGEAG